MARTWIPVRDLEAGDVPSVCAKTGAKTETLYPMQFSIAPFRSLTASRQVIGLVPLRQEVHRHLATLVSGRWWSAAVSLTCMMLAVATRLAGVPLGISQALAWAGISALGCAGVFTTFSLLRSVSATIDDERAWVRLTGVHPRFAAAVEAGYATADVARLVRPLGS
jgi:hypothetical protein